MTAGSSEHDPSPIAESRRPPTPEVSVIISTYNRGPLLRVAIESVLDQDPAITPPFELIVVDNNSSDATPTVAGAFAAADRRVRCVFEPRQGLSFARNSGIAHARAPLIAFTDDDVRVERDWIAAIVRAFRERPDADLVGGRVLPIWPASPPAWLTREHWAPLALVDHGDAAMTIGIDRPVCLVGACLACRRSLFDGGLRFATRLQRVKQGIGSLEDHEFLLRVLRSGRIAFYDPRIVVRAEVQPERLQRVYHRRWHAGHGHFHALLRSEEMERTRLGTLFGVPAHLYRQALTDVIAWLRGKARADHVRALRHELRLRFFIGFFTTRLRDFFTNAPADRALSWWRRRLPARRGVPLAAPSGGGAGGAE
jgi:glycosyltransferase involved in cell wall biosynthesis